ncbi:hypothetical protein QYE76_041883 [Lolium multiflorum]|uniref:Retrotransposon gag domain-containing protein n=1 Tax=Lolium multiflorum TaxID=4521 RepID=A0AAD8TDU2_LOLMU|nr:hypothetical protein QYE76_041883 [Lolium multiflorum]
MMEDGDEEEDNDDQYRSMFSECDDTAMDDNEEEGGEEQASDDPVDDDLRRAISDARRDCGTDKERLQFDKMLEDHHKLLYPGCEDGHRKLGSILELLKWKAEVGVTDSGFEKLMIILKKLFPRNNELPVSTYEAKKLVCPLGLDVQKIHACINDCILYRGEKYENLNKCPICGALRYKIRKDDPGDVEGEPPRKRVPAKATLARPVGQSSATTTSTSASEMADEPIKYEDMLPEHKKKYDDLKATFEADLIGSFEKTPPQQQGSPAYVVYKVGGDPGDYQFLYEPPKEIPHGYVCTYVPDCNNWANQITTGGVAGTGVVAGAGGGSGADAEKQAWLAKYATGTSHERSTSAAPTADQIAAILRDQFGILPKKRMISYSKPYPNEYDLIPLPPKYRLPDFTKFSGSEGSSSIEHVSRYLAQLGMVSASDELRVRFFSQSLTGPAFGWYTSLPPDSVRTWKQLEEQFHIQYHSEATEAGIADLTQVRQRRGETVSEYIQRFRTVRNRCNLVRLSEKEACELAIAGLSAPLKDVTFQADYNSLAHMVQKLTSYEQRHPELYQDKFKRVALIEMEEDEDSAEDQEVAVAEWTRGAKPVPANG